jgi:hypothetical protein
MDKGTWGFYAGVFAVIVATSAFADDSTYNQRLAGQMAQVLRSEHVQEFFADRGEPGILQGIQFLYSGRALHGPAVFQMNVGRRKDSQGLKFEDCPVRIEYNLQREFVMSLREGICRSVE